VTVTVSDGSANYGAGHRDYGYDGVGFSIHTYTKIAITFGPGETTKLVSVPVIGDALTEYDETFFMRLSDVLGANIARAEAIGTIIDDDPPTFSAYQWYFDEGDPVLPKVLVARATLSAPTSSTVTIPYETAYDSAGSGDFDSTSGTLTLLPGELEKFIEIQAVPDLVYEANETFLLNFFDPQHALLPNSSLTMEILMMITLS